MFQRAPAINAWLGREGIQVSSHRSLEDLTPALLRPFHVVVLHQHRLAPSLTPAVRRGLTLLRDHAAAGGGLLVTKDLYSRRGAAFYRALLSPLGAEVLQEQLVERDPGYTYRLKTLGPAANLFAWTDAMAAGHPVTLGVRGLYYSVGRWEPGEPGSLPLKVSRAWTVLVRGRPSVVSLASRPTGFDPSADNAGPGTHRASPPLLAVRSLKRGRVAVWPTLASFTLLDGFSPVLEGGLVMRSTRAGRPSDGGRLLANLLRWLAPGELPAGVTTTVRGLKAATTPTAKPLTWGRRVVPVPASGARAFRGIIGAFSTLSGGRSTPEELVEAARGAGYDFIAFAEDLSALKREGWERLVRLCRAESDSQFRAVPGLLYRGADSDPFIALGEIGFPPAAWADPLVPGKKIASNTTLRMALNPVPAIIHLPLPDNRRPARLHAAFSGHALEVWRGGPRLAWDLQGYLALQREGLGLFPTAVRLVDTGDQVTAAASSPGLQAWIRADGLGTLLQGVQGLRGAGGRYQRLGFASSGPEVVAFSVANWGTSDLARSGRHRFRLKLRVRSTVGLKEVRVLDGGRTWRRFLPRGARTFSATVDGNHDRQHSFVLQVTDTRGGRAVSWARNTAVQELSLGTSTDNLNDVGPMGKVALDRGQIRLRGTEQATRAISPGVFRRLAGLVAAEPLTGQRLASPGRHASMQRSLLVGRFGAVTEHSLARLWKGPGLPGIAHATPVVDNPVYGGVVRRTRLARLPPGPELEVREFKLRLKRPVRMLQTPGVVLAESASWGLRSGELDHVLLPGGQGSVRRWTPDGPRTQVVELAPGAFVAAYPQPTAVFALDRPLQALVRRKPGPGGATLIQVGLGRKGETLPAGTVLRARLGLLTLPRATQGTYPWLPTHRSLWTGPGLMLQVRDGLGLAGPPGYLIQPTVGRVAGSGMLLRLSPDEGGFSARVGRSELPLPVPALLSGLNPGWSAVLLYRGKNRILTAEWPPGWFRGAPSHRRFVRLRRFQDPIYPVGVSEDGVALAQLDLHDEDRDLFLGHPVVCDRPDIKLTFVHDQARDEASVEVHNPTDLAATVLVRPGKGFQLFGDFTRKVKVDSGASVVFRLRKPVR